MAWWMLLEPYHQEGEQRFHSLHWFSPVWCTHAVHSHKGWNQIPSRRYEKCSHHTWRKALPHSSHKQVGKFPDKKGAVTFHRLFVEWGCEKCISIFTHLPSTPSKSQPLWKQLSCRRIIQRCKTAYYSLKTPGALAFSLPLPEWVKLMPCAALQKPWTPISAKWRNNFV